MEEALSSSGTFTSRTDCVSELVTYCWEEEQEEKERGKGGKGGGREEGRGGEGRGQDRNYVKKKNYLQKVLESDSISQC